jgi:hypothetical protein
MIFKTRSYKIICSVIMMFFIAAGTVNAAQSGTEVGRGEFDFNPAGFLMFGPIVNLGFRVGESTFIDGNFRWSYPGLIYQVLETDGFENEANINGGGVGTRVIHLFIQKGSPHCMYIGGIFEYTWGGSKYTDDDYPSENWERKWRGYALMANIGYRFRFESGFYMQLGGMAGFHNQYKAEWHHTDSSDKRIHEDPEGVRLIAMLEFAVGTEFGR